MDQQGARTAVITVSTRAQALEDWGTCFGVIPLHGRGGWGITHQLPWVCSTAALRGCHSPALWSALCEGHRRLQLVKICRNVK